ncbi:hypothetical protein BDY24DRAFT_383371 [Mrakia frigida]|uniref:mitochondrial 54S ribosomal protein mL54 MRPL37 n=1 Tax=Mrakia frigida TaxID=29902 RepID=UPI003FCC05E7
MSLLSRTALSASSALRSSFFTPIASTSPVSSLRLSSSTPPPPSSPETSSPPPPTPAPEVPYARFKIKPLDVPTVSTWVHPPSATLPGTPIPEIVVYKTQAVPVALADDEYPNWLWKLIGEGKQLVKDGKEPAERGIEWDEKAPRRAVAAA